MPKKKPAALAKIGTAATTLTAVNLNSTLNINDVLSIVTSQSETRYQGELQKAKAELKAANEHRDGIRSSLKKQCAQEYAAAAATIVAVLEPTVKSLGGTIEAHKSPNHHTENLTRNNGKIVAHATVYGNERGAYGTTFSTSVEPSEKFKELETSLAAAEEDIKRIQSIALQWRQKLADIPALERRCRAKLATRKLAETQGGQELLEALTQEIEAAFDSPPSDY